MTRLLILIVVAAAFFHPSVATVAMSQLKNEHVELLDRVQKWRKWGQEFSNYTVMADTGKIRDGKAQVNRRIIQRKAGGFLCIRLEYSEGKGLANSAVIQNPGYSAVLQLGLNNEWVLTALIIHGEPDYEKRLADVVVGVDYFESKIFNTGVQIIPAVLDQTGYTMTAVEATGETIVYSLEFKQGHPTAPQKIAKLRLHFAKSGLAPPVQIDYDFGSHKGSRVFLDWTKVKGNDVPTKDVFYTPEFMSPGMTPTQTATFDYTTYDTPFDKASCNLTHYGLSEPAQVSGRGLSWWIVTGVGAILVIVGFVVRQRRAATN